MKMIQNNTRAEHKPFQTYFWNIFSFFLHVFKFMRMPYNDAEILPTQSKPSVGGSSRRVPSQGRIHVAREEMAMSDDWIETCNGWATGLP